MQQSINLREMFAQRHDSEHEKTPYDVGLVLIAICLFTIGFVIVTSASIPIATRIHDNPFYFSIRHAIYIGIALVASIVVINLPMQFWRKSNPYLLFVAIALLIAVLFIGRTVNGSTRWIVVGPITIQAAEPAKLFFFCYLAGYLVRRKDEVTEQFKGFFKPLIIFFLLGFLLLNQPDLGTAVVMFVTTIALLFLAGAKLWQFFAMFFSGLAAVVGLIVVSEYRMRRITAFLDPWADPFGSGYQLTQSLMAFGRGSWFGQGLGNSVQKLEFLPEAHTDFIAAILAEELGFIGVLVVLTLILLMIIKALRIGHAAMAQDKSYDAFLAYAIGVWFSFQTAINIGASSGILPTKGLTLPLVSYGGSSLIVMSVAVAILLRIDFELRVEGVQAIKKNLNKTKKRKGRSRKQTLDEDAEMKNRTAEDAHA
ncbi:cell division protein FtsW [Glaciecola sp. KUL10]|uniref:cell division protein FtsW n=1 Tax=Glaciecola sp. (strain KUL10) TaxID=2161813 RepID=UPI000D785963|nr:cell division protein FtsW [Glaciecola sp. KUL10]GBL05621.1 cell division protein FtsW [Glaciecola sp. KUL10]